MKMSACPNNSGTMSGSYRITVRVIQESCPNVTGLLSGCYKNNHLITDDDDKTGVYYFAKPIDTDATMKTGTVNLTIDGDSYAFKFKSSGATKGKGINGREDSSYYVNGRKVKADSDNKYEIYECTIDENTGKVETLVGGDLTAYQFLKLADQSGDFAVISSAGTIVKSGTKKDGDDYKLVIKDYLLTAIKNTDGDVIWEAE